MPATARPLHAGMVDWHHLVQWLKDDGVISDTEARRTVARCSQAESAQHPLVRLASVAMERAVDGKPLDIEMLTAYVAQRCGMDYLRIDPLRVDVGKVADTMSASYAERHKVLPVQVSTHELVVATAEPFITDWVAEVERQARRTVRRVLVNPLDIQRYTVEFFALAKRTSGCWLLSACEQRATVRCASSASITPSSRSQSTIRRHCSGPTKEDAAWAVISSDR